MYRGGVKARLPPSFLRAARPGHVFLPQFHFLSTLQLHFLYSSILSSISSCFLIIPPSLASSFPSLPSLNTFTISAVPAVPYHRFSPFSKDVFLSADARGRSQLSSAPT